jgi:type I restriction-modification system DNA methylase subunit
LEEVIQLPVGIFPGSTARACVLVLNRRKSTHQRGRVTFVDLSRQFAGTPNQSELTADGIAQALAATKGSSVDGISITVDHAVIRSNDFDLEVRRYLSKSVWRGETFAREWETYQQLLIERNRIESAVEDVLKKLGPSKTEDRK